MVLWRITLGQLESPRTPCSKKGCAGFSGTKHACYTWVSLLYSHPFFLYVLATLNWCCTLRGLFSNLDKPLWSVSWDKIIASLISFSIIYLNYPATLDSSLLDLPASLVLRVLHVLHLLPTHFSQNSSSLFPPGHSMSPSQWDHPSLPQFKYWPSSSSIPYIPSLLYFSYSIYFKTLNILHIYSHVHCHISRIYNRIHHLVVNKYLWIWGYLSVFLPRWH